MKAELLSNSIILRTECEVEQDYLEKFLTKKINIKYLGQKWGYPEYVYVIEKEGK